jgi:signal transduction histidine kinase
VNPSSRTKPAILHTADPSKKLLNARDACRRIAHLVRTALEPSIRVTLDLSPRTGEVHGDSGEIDQVILNLILNAWDAMPDGGDLLVSTANVDRETGGRIEKFVRIVVADNGAGIAPEIHDHIFNPWFTTKPHGLGHGTGLAAVDRIVRGSGGEIEVRSAVGRGTSFEILLPRINDPETAGTHGAMRAAA